MYYISVKWFGSILGLTNLETVSKGLAADDKMEAQWLSGRVLDLR